MDAPQIRTHVLFFSCWQQGLQRSRSHDPRPIRSSSDSKHGSRTVLDLQFLEREVDPHGANALETLSFLFGDDQQHRKTFPIRLALLPEKENKRSRPCAIAESIPNLARATLFWRFDPVSAENEQNGRRTAMKNEDVVSRSLEKLWSPSEVCFRCHTSSLVKQQNRWKKLSEACCEL